MIICNKIDKVLGPLASYGLAFFSCLSLAVPYQFIVYIRDLKKGIYDSIFELLYFDTVLWIIWALLLVASAFIAFTTTCTEIDTINKRVKFKTKLFGIISSGGKWTYLTSDMKLGFKKSRKKYRYYGTRGTNSMLVEYNDLRIFLCSNKNRVILPMKKLKSEKNAKEELTKLSKLLELKII